ncbi:hypothetical protein BC936DRAFT_137285 [Jimgerdemannia flammicorona]|uniref:choline-phosphate cytidylyltransferase n=1 Tax=Jimgerdemannia flammicorona TaxID=994334 RepID=A0A433CXQ8_9FUNG|nr:hypothetical protein BC936DRAFT_137285 [Jimgerdemannia flammicorona]
MSSISSKRKRPATDKRSASAASVTTVQVPSPQSPTLTPAAMPSRRHARDDDPMDQPTSRDASDEDNTDTSASAHPNVGTSSTRIGVKRTKTNELLDNSLPVPASHYNFKINAVGYGVQCCWRVKNLWSDAPACSTGQASSSAPNPRPSAYKASASLFHHSRRTIGPSESTATVSTTYSILATLELWNKRKNLSPRTFVSGDDQISRPIIRNSQSHHPYLPTKVCSDVETHKRKGKTVMTDHERYESLRHCKWVDEVVENAPWVVDQSFIDQHKVGRRLADFIVVSVEVFP